MHSFPSATNLRLVVDSQRLLSAGLAKLAAKIDPDLQQAWLSRAQTYLDLQHELRDIGGRVGTGGLAVAEGANAVSRLKEIRPVGDFDRRVLHAFSTIFTKLDTRIADVIETGIKRNAYFARMKLPRIVENSGQMVAPPRERYIPLGETDHTPSSNSSATDSARPPSRHPRREAPPGAESNCILRSCIVPPAGQPDHPSRCDRQVNLGTGYVVSSAARPWFTSPA